MISLVVQFWTNDISEDNKPLPKNLWDSGMVRFEKNTLHGIESIGTTPFHSMLHLPGVIEKLLITHGLKMRLSEKTIKYYAKEQAGLKKKKQI